MSRKGNCLDNAVIENFFGLLKKAIEGLAACGSQTTSPFGSLNNFYFERLSNFFGAVHFRLLLFHFSILNTLETRLQLNVQPGFSTN